MLNGTYTAMVTPFKNGEVDFKALENMVEWQIQSGINGLVPCGSTGEFATLSMGEQSNILKRCVEISNKRVPVIAGTSDITPKKVIELAENARNCGVDAIMVVVPYYVKPTQDQIYEFYKSIDDHLKFPLLLYNNPGRCGVNLSVDNILKLAQRSTIIGIKEADSDITRPTQILNGLNRGDFSILSGNSSSTAGFLAQGGHGVVSVTSNVDPVRCALLVKAWKESDISQMQNLSKKLLPFDEGLYIEPAPATIKYALAQRGVCSDEVRPPLMPLSDKHHSYIQNLLNTLKLGPVHV